MTRQKKKYGSVLTYARPVDMAVLVVSGLLGLLAGGLNPVMTIIYSHFVGSFQEFADNEITGRELSEQVARWSLYYVYLAVAEFVLIYIATVGFYISGERISRALRATYLRSVFQREMALFDEFGVGDLTTRITTDINRIQEALSSKLALAFTAAATFSVSLVIALTSYWSLALVVVFGIAVIGMAEALGGRFAVRFQARALRYYSTGSSMIQETISAIRHVYAFGLQDAMAQRYEAQLRQAQSAGMKARFIIALMVSVMNSAPYFIYATAFWQGVRLIFRGYLIAAEVVQITMATVTGAFSVGRIAPALESFIASIASARPLIETIATCSQNCDPFSSEGETMSEIQGTLTLRNMSLVYPARPLMTVLKNIDCEFPAFSTIAVVGESGSGKSSIVNLIERFYTPSEGCILLDGHDIQKLNLNWLRRQIAVVSQEPILFNTTIFENIQHGLHDHDLSEVDLKDRVIAAAKKSNAHDFITALPEGYNTVVGIKGMQLSGGQRQRISLARALISDSRILILDEASSALDAMSEQAIHVELESTSKHRTTIVITHRLSTIRTADSIIVLDKGSIAEQGNHNELMALNGLYARLVERQRRSDSDSTSVVSDNLDFDHDNQSRGSSHTLEVTRRLDNKAIDFRSPVEQEDQLRDIMNDEKKDAGQPSFFTYVKTVYRYHRPERGLIVIGVTMCIFCGLVWPVNSVIFGEVISALSLVHPNNRLVSQFNLMIPLRSTQDFVRQVDFWALMFTALGIAAWFVWLCQGVCFAISSEKLVVRAKNQVFQTLLHQDIQFFDEKAHSPGALASLVSTSTDDLAGLSGPVLGSVLTFITTIVVGIVISMIAGWKLALVCTSAVPIVAACGWLRLRILVIFDRQIRKTNEDAAAYASEMVSAIRTVASLCLEQHAIDEYKRLLEQQAHQSVKTILRASILYAFAHSFTYLSAALAFYYGGNMVVLEGYSITSVFVCFTALVSGSQIAGAVFSFVPDASKAIHASQELKGILERSPQIELKCPDTIPPNGFKGHIEFESVSFWYPTRPDQTVVDTINLTIKPGQYIAIVGPSGSGKSTIIALLERFFDPGHGRILIDGKDISALDVREYRQQLSLVSQEPILFQGTIHENLLLGAAKDTSEEDVLHACKEANLSDFIASLSDGLNTYIGLGGTMLSGGQKQRIAIARALLRKTNILLLDEATSALDSESERLVQEALDRAAKRRTTIAIAHRLSTIWHADVICVLDRGRLVESGTHGELMAREGMYYRMVQIQNREGV